MYKLSTIVFLVFFGLFFSSVKTQAIPCPLGQTTVYKTFTISYGGTTCVVEAQICAVCPLTNPLIELGIQNIKTPGCPGIPPGKIYELVALQLIDRAQEICQIEPCSAPSTSRIMIRTPACIVSYRYEENTNIYEEFIPCDFASYCEKEYTKCFDTLLGRWVTTIVGMELIGTPDCTDYGPSGLHDIDYTDGNTSECFRISCQ